MSALEHIHIATQILKEHYQLDGKLSVLPGETDYNYKVDTKNGDTYILKVSKTTMNVEALEFQNAILEHLKEEKAINVPEVIATKDGDTILKAKVSKEDYFLVRLCTWIEGRLWDHVNPKNEILKKDLGVTGGRITKALSTFKHSNAQYNLDWDIAQSSWTTDKLHLVATSKQEILKSTISSFEAKSETYKKLPKQVIHNDANENNIVVSMDKLSPEIIGFIDYGDAIYTQRINDLGIMCAYASMNHLDSLRAILPIITGYHESCPLTEDELYHLYSIIQMRFVISILKAAENKIEYPENEYLLISENAAWDALEKWSQVDEEFALLRFRESVGLPPHPLRNEFNKFANTLDLNLNQLFPTINRTEVHPLDLSVSSMWIGHEEDFNNLDWFQYKIDELQKEVPQKIIAGGYIEPRPLYTDDSFDTEADFGKQNRSVHLGVDFWLPAGTAVHAIFKGKVVTSTHQKQHKNYGGLIILEHRENELTFFTLYGHLSKKSSELLSEGDVINKGKLIGHLGTPTDNGSWAPHLHFQVQLSLLDFKNDFPGVAFHHEIETWKSLCPDPMMLFGIDTLSRKRKKTISNNEIMDYRKQHLGLGMSLQYDSPIQMARGNGVYLLDQHGQKYLDTINNVAHVGHEHFEIVKAGRNQMAVLNTNTRYLHQNIVEFSEALLETLPKELSVLHFVNSGSEANELAIRMARAVTGSTEIIASEMGYHGNTNATIDISSYKFDGEGGFGSPNHTHIFPLPDTYRGKYRGDGATDKYIAEVQKCIDTIEASGKKVSALIIESIISCGGQIELPDGFLKNVFARVRKAGGICISDEVQTGVGRVGKHFWGFELHGVTPDIVTIGKPIGNGHPVAVVACTPEVAKAFANGMEYFNTYGGNPVSCAIGAAVLQTVRNENLQENALTVGSLFKKKLKQLATEFPIIDDVRGQGLFLGFELVNRDCKPLPHQASYLVNRMRDYKILMSTDGRDNNVIKIKPPLVFSSDNVEVVISSLRRIFQEDFMKI